MALAIYKPGQGYWTRVLSAAGAGTLILAGGAWLAKEMEAYTSQLTRVGTFVAVLAIGGAVVFWLLNKPRIVDFLIATEAEMRKVNWPSQKEVRGSTWVVICGTFMLAFLLFVIDILFSELFMNTGILKGQSILKSFFGG